MLLGVEVVRKRGAEVDACQPGRTERVWALGTLLQQDLAYLVSILSHAFSYTSYLLSSTPYITTFLSVLLVYEYESIYFLLRLPAHVSFLFRRRHDQDHTTAREANNDEENDDDQFDLTDVLDGEGTDADPFDEDFMSPEDGDVNLGLDLEYAEIELQDSDKI
jgi:hypothetical protein